MASLLASKLSLTAKTPYDTAASPTLPHAALFNGLRLASSPVAEAFEVEKFLDDYDQAVPDKDKSILYLLAHARLALQKGAKPLAVALLQDFKARCEAAKELACAAALTSNEQHLLREYCKELQPPAPSVSAQEALEEKWAALSERLADEQCEPMDALMDMVGLDGPGGPKATALDMYVLGLNDKEERAKGQKPTPRSLNYAFVGNPGA
jgi:hypothetical protein